MAWNAERLLAALPAPDAPFMRVAELAAALELDGTSASRACRVLRNRGLAEAAKAKNQTQGAGAYRLTAAGAAARDAGSTIRGGQGEREACRRLVRTTMRDRLWKALRIARNTGQTYTIDELVEMAADGTESDARGSAQSYIFALARAGYLRKHRIRARSGAPRSKGAFRYVLIRDTGPKTPIWRRPRNSVFDPNRNEEHQLGAAS